MRAIIIWTLLDRWVFAMFQALLICFREGLEAFLIVAIAALFLRRAHNHALLGALRWGVMTALAIDPSLMKPEEKDILEDLILAAHSDAKNKSEAMMAEEMKSVTGGLPLPPGFKLPF